MNQLPITVFVSLALPALTFGEVIVGGADAGSVDNWTTNSLIFNQGTSDGFSLDWENVLTNQAVTDSANNEFDLEWEAASDFTIGHLFMFNTTVDLADLAGEGGVQSLDWSADFETSDFANWSPVISFTDGGVTTYYRWNHSGDNWNGNGPQDFSLGVFDLSQLGNGTGPGAGNTVIWGEMRAIPDGTITNFGQTRINDNTPDLQSPTGVLGFGFIQWASDAGGSIPSGTSFSTSVDSFEVVVNAEPEPPTLPAVSTLPALAERATSATLRGEVTDDGNDPPAVTIYFGTSDGEDSPAAWDDSVEIGQQAGAFQSDVTGLMPETTYFYRAFASNAAGGAWADSSESVTTLALTGIDAQLDSEAFAFRYEMDVSPGSQDLDMAGNASDWFSGVAGGVTIPAVSGGVAMSNALAATPEVLFRTDFGGSIQRQSLAGGDFTLEVALRVIGPLEAGDAGIFGLALDPGGDTTSFRLNIDTDSVSLDGDRSSEIASGSNADTFHVYRIAWQSALDQWTAWRDGEEIYSALAGTNGPFNDGGGMFLGDFSGSLSGEWEVDYIRLHNQAVAPLPEGELELLGIQIVDGDVELIWRGAPNTEYLLYRSTDLVGWEEISDELNGGSGEIRTDRIEPTAEGGRAYYRLSEF